MLSANSHRSEPNLPEAANYNIWTGSRQARSQNGERKTQNGVDLSLNYKYNNVDLSLNYKYNTINKLHQLMKQEVQRVKLAL